MPIYEYHCSDCDLSFESLVRAGDEAATCSSCGGTRIARELSVFASSRGSGAPAGSDLSRGRGGALGGGGCCGGGCGCR